MTYLSDPEGVPDDWDEPILAEVGANHLPKLMRFCKPSCFGCVPPM